MQNLTTDQIVFCSIYLIACFMIAVGNSLVILAFIVDPRIRNPSNTLLLSLSITDLLLGLFTFPKFIIEEIDEKAILGERTCQLWLDLIFLLNIVSSNHLIIIAVDRYQIVFEGVPYLQRRSMTKSVLVPVSVVWFISFWIVFPNVVNPASVYTAEFPKFACRLIFTSSFLSVLNLAIVVFPGVIISILYRGIYRQLKSRQWRKTMTAGQLNVSTVTPPNSGEQEGTGCDQNNSSFSGGPGSYYVNEMNCLYKDEKQRKAAVTLGILIAIFYICWLPYLVFCTLSTFNIHLVSGSVFRFFILLGNLNSCFNPFVYASRSQDFKAAIKLVFGKVRGICGADVA